jgi:hypothetical protein
VQLLAATLSGGLTTSATPLRCEDGARGNASIQGTSPIAGKSVRYARRIAVSGTIRLLVFEEEIAGRLTLSATAGPSLRRQIQGPSFLDSLCHDHLTTSEKRQGLACPLLVEGAITIATLRRLNAGGTSVLAVAGDQKRLHPFEQLREQLETTLCDARSPGVTVVDKYRTAAHLGVVSNADPTDVAPIADGEERKE